MTSPANPQPPSNGSEAPFVHLHVHTEYSLFDGSIRTGKAVAKAKALGHKAIAITDHGNLFGAVEFYTKAKAEGIKAIIGAEIFHEVGQPTRQLWQESEEHKNHPVPPAHLVLLAKNNQGYGNLVKIVSRAYTENFSEVPVATAKMLEDHAGEMFALSACLMGEFGMLIQMLRSTCGSGPLQLRRGDDKIGMLYEALQEHITRIHTCVGQGNYYIELIDNNLPQQQRLLPDLVTAAQHFGLPLVASADAHYLDAEFSEAHGVLLAIKSSLTFKDLRDRRRDARFHLLSNEEFLALYQAWPEAVANTLRIADACQVSFTFGKYYLPKYPIPDGKDEAQYLQDLSRQMLDDRFVALREAYGPTFDAAKEQHYRERLEYELQVIIKMGFPGYFLIVQDFINWAKSQGIPVGPGRGSGAGSLVAYALRITDLDPLRFNLLFERFLNPERISMPDFDVDFCQDRRDEVIAYVTEKYGKDNVAQITTFGKMMAKQAVRDVGRVMEVSYGRVDKISKLIPAKMPDGRAVTIKDALQIEPRLAEEVAKDDTIAHVLKVTEQLEGLNRQTGVHAAGIVMSDGPMTNYVPVYTTPVDGLITQFEMKNAEKVGLVKFDFLGLKTLTVIDHAVKAIRVSQDPNFDIARIPLDDKKVYAQVSDANTVGVFQLEGQGMQNLLLKLQPSSFEDIIAVVALFRPGPLGSGMVDDFIERKHGRQAMHYMLPELEPILKETYGIILYQEQVQKIAVVLASYTPGEADLLRRAMGKKIKAEMDAQRARFTSGAKANNIDPQKAEEIFDLMAKFAEYGFNKSHSAAYGLVSYQTAYLKAHFPEQFMASIMTCDLDKTEKIVRYVEDCRRMGIKVIPPDINTSGLEFLVQGPKKISFGLAAIKGIGATSLEPLFKDRRVHGPYSHFTHVAKRVDLHKVGKKTFELLIKSGALDTFSGSRSEKLVQLDEMISLSTTLHTAKQQKQRSLFDEHDNMEEEVAPPPRPAKNLLQLTDLEEEKRLLGTYLTAHPLAFFAEDQRRFARLTLKDHGKMIGKGEFPLVCILCDTQERRTQTGKRLIYVTLEDESAQVEAMMFAKDDAKISFPPKSTPVVAFCQMQKRPDGTISRLKVERVITLQEARAGAIKEIALDIVVKPEQKASNDALVNRISNHLKSRRGATKCLIRYRFPEATVTLRPAGDGIYLDDETLLQLKYMDVGVTYDPTI